MAAWWKDVRFGMRMLLRSPGFAAAMILMLALGIGINTAIFSVFNGVLLQPLPYPEPGRLLQVWEERGAGQLNTVSAVNWVDWRAGARNLESIAVYGYEALTLTGEGEARRLVGSLVSEGFFETLGVAPLLGRAFLPEEDRPGAGDVVVLSHGLWERSFGADPEVLGRSLTLNAEPYTVVGVMPSTFAFPGSAVDLWMPHAIDLAAEERGHHFLFSIARLADGVELATAQAEIDGIAARLAEEYPGTNENTTVRLVPLLEETVGEARPALMVLLAAVALVLLIACANVASLMLARGSVRGKEIAVRAALGAGRGALARQLLTESMLIALIAGFLGTLFAHWGVRLFLWISGGGVPRAGEIGVDPWVLAFALGVSILTGLICGAVPALQASRADLSHALQESGRTASASPRRRRAHAALVVAEVAIGLILLVGCGLLTRSFLELRRVDPGFQPDRVLTFQISLPPSRYSDGHRQAAFFRDTMERIAQLQGVAHVGATRGLPFAGSRSSTSFELEGRPQLPSDPSRNADVRLATPGFFQALGIPLLRGRLVQESDGPESRQVVVINEEMAQRFWPDEDPLGRKLRPFNPPVEVEVVGVVGNSLQGSLHERPAPAMYVPYRQRPHYKMSIVVRGDAASEALVPAIRKSVQSLDADQPIYSIASMRERLDASVSEERFSASLLTVFAAAALALALVGVYGVLSFAVSERTREIGVRMALGADRAAVLRLIVGGGVRLCAAGVVVGLVAALALTRILSGMLFGISATDPLVLVGTAALMIGTGLLASLTPALRAARVDPQEALRYE